MASHSPTARKPTATAPAGRRSRARQGDGDGGGLVGVLDHRVSDAYDGLELADSAIVDPHKWLAAPVGVAATFGRDREILHRAFTQEPGDDIQSPFDSMGVPYGGAEPSGRAPGAR